MKDSYLDETNPQYDLAAMRWKRTRDCNSGSQAMKLNDLDYVTQNGNVVSAVQNVNYNVITNRYILKPDETNNSAENNARYRKLVELAQFFNGVSKTLSGMLGAIYRVAPTTGDTLPATLEYIADDVDGGGLGIDQQSQAVTSDVLLVGRGFLLVDYPSMEGDTSAAQMQNGIRPRILFFPAESVVDWHESYVGGVKKLDYVKIAVCRYELNVMTGQREEVTEYRILRLIDGVYTSQEIDEEGNEGEVIAPIASGSTLNFIPGVFVGATNNNPDVDDAPLYDLAEVNIGHYRNSADNEEASFICGQPTLAVTTDYDADTWAKQNPNGVQIGSRRGHLLGSSGSMVMVQAEATGMPRELMKDKENQMIMLGAQLITPEATQQTATGASISLGQSTSVLAMVAQNVSEAYTQCLKWMQMFISPADPVDVEYSLNTDFFPKTMTAQDALNWASAVQQGTPVSIVYQQMRDAGLTVKTDEELDAEVSAQGMESLNLDMVADGES